MAILIDVDMGEDNEVMCSECEVVFTVYWRRDGITHGLCFCPFCGDELEDETTDDMP